MPSSTKLALTTGILLSLFWAWKTFSPRYQLNQYTLQHLKPGRVNLIGITSHSGYEVILSNQMARLVKENKVRNFGPSNHTQAEASPQAPQIPLKYILGALNNEETSLRRLFGRIHSLDQNPQKTSPNNGESQPIFTLKQIQKDQQVQNLLNHTFVLLNEKGILQAEYTQNLLTSTDKNFQLTLTLTSTARSQLNKFYAENKNCQLILTVNGHGIAAPKLRNPLYKNKIIIFNIKSQKLLEQLITSLNQ